MKRPIAIPLSHVGDLRPSHQRLVEVYDWADDAELNPDLTPPNGTERVDVDGWLRTEIG